MKYPKLSILLAIIIVAGVAAVFLHSTTPEAEAPAVIGGERDEYGCLGPAGYTYDETIGACARSFELTPDIAAAARLAVESVGSGYALTVVAWNAYEEPGAYDIMLERGVERAKETVYIRGGVVVPEPLGS